MVYEYKFEIEKCWYKDHCNLFNTDKCSGACPRYMEMHYLMNHANLPTSKMAPIRLTPTTADTPAYKELKEIQKDINNFVTGGESLYIYSRYFGNGKTSWGIKLLHSYFDCIWLGNGFRCRGIFISVPDFLYRIKNFKVVDAEFEYIKSLLAKVDLVIWDDVGATNMSGFDYGNLLYFIDQRVLDNKSNVYTGNLSQKELIKVVGDRLTSRIWNNSIRVEFRGKDRRDIK